MIEIRYYIDGKCVLSYDDDVFSEDEDYTNNWFSKSGMGHTDDGIYF